MNLEENYVQSFDNSKIFYKKLKQSGPWVVLLHGGSGSSNSWCFQLPYLVEKGYSLIVLDQRGHGLSERGENLDFFKVDNYVKDLKAVLDEENIEKAFLAGHSFGGQIVQKFYQHFPEKTKGLIFISTKFNHSAGLVGVVTNLIMRIVFALGSSGKPNNNYSDYEKYRNTADLNPFRILRDIKCCSFKTYSATIILGNKFRNPDYKDIKIPSLLIHGKKDMIMPHKQAEIISKEMTNFELVTLPTNHITLLNLPNEINQVMDNFLRKIT